MTTQHWLEGRQKLFITGTDCVFAIKEFCPEFMKRGTEYFYNTYNKTKFQFYYEKTMSIEMLEKMNNIPYNQADKEKKKIMQEGKDREEEIRQRIEQEKDIKLISNGENLFINEEFNIGATPDFFSEIDSEKIIVECKLLNPISDYVCQRYCYDNGLDIEQEDVESIREKIKFERQLRYQFQVNLQLYCANLKKGILATAKKKTNDIDSEITEIEYQFVEENKTVQANIVEASKRIKKWFEDIKNGIIPIPTADLTNSKDLLICDLLELNEEASIKWKAWRMFMLDEEVKEHNKLDERLKYTLKLKYDNQSYSEKFNIDGIDIELNRNVYKDTLWTEENLNKEIQDTLKKLKELENIQLGSIKRAGNTKLTIKKVFNGE